MKNLPLGIIVLMALFVIGIGYVALGKDIYDQLAQNKLLHSLGLILLGVGTLLSLVKNIGGLLPVLVGFGFVFKHQGLESAVITATLAGMVLWFGLIHADAPARNPKKFLVAYEWLGALSLSGFSYVLLYSSLRVIPLRFFPIGAGVIVGALAVAGELLKSAGLKEREIRQFMFFLSIVGISLGLILGRVFRPTFIPS